MISADAPTEFGMCDPAIGRVARPARKRPGRPGEIPGDKTSACDEDNSRRGSWRGEGEFPGPTQDLIAALMLDGPCFRSGVMRGSGGRSILTLSSGNQAK
jgi:hypothetical protein